MDSAKKKSTKQMYKKTYLFITNCTSKGDDNNHYAHCTYCDADFYIAASGSRDIKRHQSGLRHSERKKARLGSKNQQNVLQFMKNREKSMEQQLKEEEEKTKADAAAKKFLHDTTRSEVLLIELIAQLNLSMNSADTFTSAFKIMFPDSKIAEAFSCARTKTTAIVKDIAKKHKHTLLARMKSAPFSLATDGSNDSNSKLFPIVVRTVNPDTLSVESEVVSLPVLEDSSTGKNIF